MSKISIVITCYNGTPYLTAAIESVQSQTLKEWELIYVDDCSKDNSLKVAESYAAKDSRIKVIRNDTNLGMVGNWNKACEISQSPYIKLLCADDVIYPSAIATQVEILDKHPSVGLVTSPSWVLNSRGDTLLTRRPLNIEKGLGHKIFSAEDTLRACIAASANLLGEPSIVTFRRALFDKVGGFNNAYKYGTDLEFYLRLLIDGHCDLAVGDQVTAGFRLHPGSLTNTQMQRGADELCKIFNSFTPKIPGVTFDSKKFKTRYGLQTLIKGKIIKIAENPWGIKLLHLIDNLRMAAG